MAEKMSYRFFRFYIDLSCNAYLIAILKIHLFTCSFIYFFLIMLLLQIPFLVIFSVFHPHLLFLLLFPFLSFHLLSSLCPLSYRPFPPPNLFSSLFFSYRHLSPLFFSYLLFSFLLLLFFSLLLSSLFTSPLFSFLPLLFFSFLFSSLLFFFLHLMQGDWVQGLRHGYGAMRYPSGNMYEGEWVADKVNWCIKSWRLNERMDR